MESDSKQYLEAISEIFYLNKNIHHADQMKSYMRNKFEFLGIKSPERKQLQKEILKTYGMPSPVVANYIVKQLWKLPEREFQYFAMDILFRTIRRQSPFVISLCEEIILEKSWWDTVDFIAASIIGAYFRMKPDMIMPFTGKWMDSGNIWLQRTCLLFQLKYKHQTDLMLLYSFIDRLKDSDEFFIRKAIGWSLREYSKTDPNEIQEYVKRKDLKPLSRVEALKVIARNADKVVQRY